MIHPPVPVGVGCDRCTLVRIGPEVVEPGNACVYKGLSPDEHGALGALLCKHHLPVVVTDRLQVAIIGEIEELLPWALLLLTR